MADLSSQIETNSGAPKSATVDGNSAQQHSLREQIEADRYLKSQAATKAPQRGLKITKLSAPGTT